MADKQRHKVRQHTVPRHYLKAFSLSGSQIQQFDRQTRRHCVVSIDDASVVKRIYSVRLADGTWDSSIEDYFMRLENDVSPILGRLLRTCTISDSDQNILGLYLARQIQRGRLVADFARSEAVKFRDPRFVLDFIETRRNEFEVRCGGKQKLDEMVKRFEAEGNGVEIDDKTYLGYLIEETPKSAAIFANMSWRLERSRTEYFATSDQPVAIRRRANPLEHKMAGLLDQDSEVFFPLALDTMLVMSANKVLTKEVAIVGDDRVLELNRITVVNAYRFVYSPVRSQALDAILQQHADDAVRFREFDWLRDARS